MYRSDFEEKRFVPWANSSGTSAALSAQIR
jgi:hypothetical protein